MSTPTIYDFEDWKELEEAFVEANKRNKARIAELKAELIPKLEIILNMRKRVFKIGLVMTFVNPAFLTLHWCFSNRIDWLQLIFWVLWIIWTIYAYKKLKYAKWELKMFSA